MTKYEQGKAKARDAAIQWQQEFNKSIFTYTELLEDTIHFRKLAKRYGLIKEFRENGII